MMPFNTKRIKLDGLQSQYNALYVRCNSINKQINYTNNLAEKDALKAQLDSIYEEMDLIEYSVMLLENEIWENQATAALKNLYEIIVMINPDVIVEAYQVSLTGKFNSDKSTTLKEKLLILEEIPDNPLPKFVNKIIADQRLLNENRKEDLKVWLTNQCYNFMEWAIENYLMIKVQKHLSSEYLLTAVLTELYSSCQPEHRECVSCIQILKPSKYLKEELSNVFCDLITICDGEYKKEILDLNIHWFLPIELMYLHVEKWSTKNDRERPSGRWCRTVVVRVYERHFFSSYDNKSERWKKYWHRLWEYQGLCAADVLDPIEVGQLVDRTTDAICGCRLLELETQSKDFWEDLIDQGLPIALWLKPSNIGTQAAETAMQTITNRAIGNLPTDLTFYRDRNIPGVEDFSLLWDNPFQPFPGSSLESNYSLHSKNTRV
jgi:vWA-MoxR associated protein C-terminal domain/Effector-associated domain 9